jgi:hypothetical protein
MLPFPILFLPSVMLFFLSCSMMAASQDRSQVSNDDPIISAVLEGAATLLDKYQVVVEGNSLTDKTNMEEPVIGCLECDLPEVPSPTECLDVFITESTGDMCITSWRVGGCSCTVTLHAYSDGFDTPYNPARTFAMAIHEAASHLGLVANCQVHPIDRVLETIARGWWEDRTG